MLALIFMFIFGIGVAFFATQNTGGVTVMLANSPVPGVPLYMVVLASILIGVVVSWVISLFDSASNFFHHRADEATISGSKNRIRDLEHKIKELEVENVRLREQRDHYRPSLKDRLLART